MVNMDIPVELGTETFSFFDTSIAYLHDSVQNVQQLQGQSNGTQMKKLLRRFLHETVGNDALTGMHLIAWNTIQ